MSINDIRREAGLPPAPGAPVVFIDTETTGLDIDHHEVWEIGIIRGVEETQIWIDAKDIDLTAASPDALRITDYYGRLAARSKAMMKGEPLNPPWGQWFTSGRAAASMVAHATSGQHLVGAVPSFDALFLTKLLRRYGFTPAWHYHLVDVEAMAAGRLGLEPPWDSHDLSRRLGVQEIDGKHTALGDARWARALYEAALGPGPGRPWRSVP